MQKFIFMLMVVLAALLVAGAWMNPSSAGQATFGTVEVHIKDSDGDGCNDLEETGDYVHSGGKRNPLNFWDFYDFNRDRIINSFDLQNLSFRWPSKVGDLLYEQKLDRWVRLIDGPYDLGPPDGVIDIFDLQAMSAQYGARCRGPTTVVVDIDAECGGVLKTQTQLEEEALAANNRIQDVLTESSSAEEIEGGVAGLADTDPSIVEAGGQKTDCVEVRDPFGRLVDVAQFTTSVDIEVVEGGEAASGGGKSYWRCTTVREWESTPFGTTIARMKHSKVWGHVKNPDNLYFGFISANPLPIKSNEIPSYWGFRFATVAESPPPTQWWYYEPYYVTSFAETKFDQGVTVSSHWLQSYLLVGFDQCYTWG